MMDDYTENGLLLLLSVVDVDQVKGKVYDNFLTDCLDYLKEAIFQNEGL